MANIIEPTDEERAEYNAWAKSRPPAVRAVAERFEPWALYRMKPTGQRVTIVSIGEEKGGAISLTVAVSADFNRVLFERHVFGVLPDDLEPCELPTAADAVGAVFTTPADVEAILPSMRAFLGIEVKH